MLLPPDPSTKLLTCQQDALAEQRKPGSSVALPFEEFEFVNVPFRRPLAEGQRQPSAECRFLFEERLDKGLQHRKTARSRRCHPLIQALALTCAHELTEV